MRTASAIARYLAGVIFLVFGLNGFLNFIPLPPPGGIAGQFMGALYASHYLWVIFAFQVIAGVFLLVNRYVPRSEEHTSELQSLAYLVCRLLLEKKNLTRHDRASLTRAGPRLTKEAR